MVDSVWKLQNGHVTLYDESSDLPLTKAFSEKTISLDEEINDLKSSGSTADIMDIGDLRRFIEKNKEAGLDTLHYEVDFHSRFSFAFSAFVLAFLAIPFSAQHVRSGGVAMSIGASIVLAFGYWALYSSGLALGRQGALPPLIAVWISNLVMVSLTGWFLLRLKR
jgi:lipopolysaccharide export system permease protein